MPIDRDHTLHDISLHVKTTSEQDIDNGDADGLNDAIIHVSGSDYAFGISNVRRLSFGGAGD